MIVPMKRLLLLCLASEKERTLLKVRSLGAVHLDLRPATGENFAGAKEDFMRAETAVRCVLKAKSECGREAVDGGAALCDTGSILAAAERLDALKSEADALKASIRKYAQYGDFDPQLLKKLLDLGIDVARVAEIPKILPPERLSVTRSRLENAEREAAALSRELAAVSLCPSMIRIKSGFSFFRSR